MSSVEVSAVDAMQVWQLLEFLEVAGECSP